MQRNARNVSRQKILAYINEYWANHHISPTVREISNATGISSTSTIHGHLQRMARDGLISLEPRVPRSICPLVTQDGTPRSDMSDLNLVMMKIDRPLTDDVESGVLVIRSTAGKVTEIYETHGIQRYGAAQQEQVV